MEPTAVSFEPTARIFSSAFGHKVFKALGIWFRQSDSWTVRSQPKCKIVPRVRQSTVIAGGVTVPVTEQVIEEGN